MRCVLPKTLVLLVLSFVALTANATYLHHSGSGHGGEGYTSDTWNSGSWNDDVFWTLIGQSPWAQGLGTDASQNLRYLSEHLDWARLGIDSPEEKFAAIGDLFHHQAGVFESLKDCWFADYCYVDHSAGNPPSSEPSEPAEPSEPVSPETGHGSATVPEPDSGAVVLGFALLLVVVGLYRRRRRIQS